MSLYCFDNVRTPEQLARMRRLAAEGVCLFCPDGRSSHPWQQPLLATEHWTVSPNEFPYPGTRLHLLLVPHLHASDLLDLPDEVRADFWTALAQVRREHGLTHYGLGVRNGDCRFTGATIDHVHAHVLVGATEPGGGPPVRMRFSARPAPGR